jgi:hypothetical protein
MKKSRLQTSLSVLLLVTFLAILAQAQEPAKQPVPSAPEAKPETWQKFTSTEGRFSVEFPGTPTHSKQAVGPSGNVPLYMYSLATSAAYGVSYFDSASTDAGPDAAKKALDLSVQGVIKDYGSEQLSVSETVVQDYPGRLLTKRLANGYTLRVKIVPVGEGNIKLRASYPNRNHRAENVSLYESAANRFRFFHLISEPKS